LTNITVPLGVAFMTPSSKHCPPPFQRKDMVSSRISEHFIVGRIYFSISQPTNLKKIYFADQGAA